MENGVLIDDAKLHHCSCKSPLCAHCSMHEALLRDSLNELGGRIDEGGDEDSDVLVHPQSMHIVDSAQSGAARKLKLPCRRNSRSFSSSLAPPPHDRLSKSWPPLPLGRASSVDSVAYADACVDLQKCEQKLNPSMLTITCSSFEDEQEIMSTHPLQQFTSPKKFTKPLSSPQGTANPRRICRYCHREFPSGRALGGHMRVHGGLEADRFPQTNHTKHEQQQFDAVMHRSSSLLRNSKREDRFAEVNCLVSGSKVLNSSGGGVFRRRINSEESMVRGIDEIKSVPTRCIDGERVPISHTEEENSLKKKEQLVKGIKDQSVIKKGVFTFKKEINTAATEKSISNDDDDLNENHVNDDDDYDNLCSSKLMVLGNASEIAPQGNMASEFVLDDGNPLHKLRPNPRPSRRRLWTDREGAIADNNKESSGSHHSLARRSSSPPTLHGPPEHVSSERARPCSECGKVFWSWKALFGHMRCHPEREWRGIQRPDASSSELDNKQFRACKKLSSLSFVAGNAELETELESDAENREECKPTQATLRVAVSAKKEGFNTNEEVEEMELIKGHSNIKKAEGLQNAEECSMKGGTKRALKSTLFEESAHDDLTPSAWPTRKRSRRSRANVAAGVKVTTTLAEPALTSETATSSELRDHEKVSVKDQEDLDVANCLVFLSSAGNEVKDSEKHYIESTQESALRKCGFTTNFGHSRHINVVSCKDVDDDDGENDGLNDDGEEDEAENFATLSKRPNAGGTMKYECSTCKRCFKSHQALGGHRASHRKTKGCFALMNQHAEETMQESKEDNIAEVDEFISSELNHWQAMGHILTVAPPLHHQQDEEKSPFMLLPSTIERLPTTFGKKKRFKGHACSICHRIFPSGQALGGHKRCHWTGEKIAESGSMASSSNNNNNKAFLQEQDEWGGDGIASAKVHQAKRGKEDGIDLNLPAPLDEEDEAGYDNAGLSSTDGMDPEVQNDVEDAELDGEEDTEGHLVDYIGGKKRCLNGLSGEWVAEGRRRREEAW